MAKIPPHPNPDVESFFAQHCAKPGHVVLAINDSGPGTPSTSIGVFSSLANAIEWAEQFNDGGVVFSPYVIDAPDFGNVPPAQIN